MMRCSERAYAMCPTRHLCGTIHEATFSANSDCAAFNRKVDSMPMTNGEMLRAMSNKDLAEFVGHLCLCSRIQETENTWCKSHAICEGCVEEWLKKPVEE